MEDEVMRRGKFLYGAGYEIIPCSGTPGKCLCDNCFQHHTRLDAPNAEIQRGLIFKAIRARRDSKVDSTPRSKKIQLDEISNENSKKQFLQVSTLLYNNFVYENNEDLSKLLNEIGRVCIILNSI